MELKEIEQELRLLDLNRNIRDLVFKMIETYGKSQYNAALDKAAECAEVKTVWYDEDKSTEVDKDSILSLKIPTK